MTNQMIIRVDSELKRKVSTLAKAEGKTTSEIVRELLEDYVRERDIGSYIDDLWDRIGSKMSSKGIVSKDIPKTIKNVRAKK